MPCYKNNSIAEEPLNLLFDSGCSHSLASPKAIRYCYHKIKKLKNDVSFNTFAGEYVSNKLANITFVLPEFTTDRTINHIFHVMSPTEKDIGYDMIIG